MSSADDREVERKLHQRMIAGDDTAPSAVAEVYFEAVVRALAKRFHRAPTDHLVLTAASDGFMSYFGSPGKFDPSKGPLLQFLRIAAEYDLRNALERETRYQLREGAAVVELPVGRSEVSIGASESSNPEYQILSSEAPLVKRAVELLEAPRDQAILRLMMDGVRETQEYASVLQVEDLSLEQQREVVKRNKDRIKKILQRHLRSAGV